MGLSDRVSRLLRANINDLISRAENPEKILEQAVIDMQEDLGKLKGAVAQAIAAQNRTQQQFERNQTEAKTWQTRAQLALQKGDEALAREALTRKQSYAQTAEMLQQQLVGQTQQTDTLKRGLMTIESKIAEAQTKKAMLKARAAAAEAQKKIGAAVNGIGTSGAMAAFERMEDKVLQMEARNQVAYELVGAGLTERFAQLEAGSAIDDELAAMKAQLLGPAATPIAELNPAPVDQTAASSSNSNLEFINAAPQVSTLSADELADLQKALGESPQT